MTQTITDLHVYLRSIREGERTSLSVLAGLTPAGATVLDLGCGTSAVGQYLRQTRQCTIDGLTWSEAEAAHARPHYRRVVVANLETCDLLETFEHNIYDVIVCADVLEHLSQPERVLGACRSLLKSGGRLLTSVPNAGYAGLIAELLQGEFRYREEGLLDRTHLRFFTRRSLGRFLGEYRWALRELDTIRRELPDSEFKARFDDLPPAVARYLLAAPDALTYQFIGVAEPVEEAASNDIPADTAPASALFTAQVFVDRGQGFLEHGKLTATGAMGIGRQTLRFDWPKDTPPIAALRLDPADRPGFLHLYALRLYDGGDAPLWQWDAQAASSSPLHGTPHQQIVWHAPLPVSGAALLLLTGDDPWFVLPVPAAALARGTRLEAELGWPMSADYLALSSAIAPLHDRIGEQQSRLDELAHSLAQANARADSVQQANRGMHADNTRLQQEVLGLQQDYSIAMNRLQSIENSIVYRTARPLVFAKRGIGRWLHSRADARASASQHRNATPVTAPAHPVDVIVPVYKGLADTQLCIRSVLAAPVRCAWRLIVINDGSPEPEVTAWLREAAAQEPRITLLENEENLGFVATVNRGMQHSGENDVLLLNSDTEVANDWLDRIRAAAYGDARVASVTPLSTNATICSYPRFCEANALPPGHTTASLDALCAQTNPGVVVDVPTGVGFCMYIRRDALREVGLFDVEHFGKGYGEENDFCQRAAAKGWRNLHLLDTFVLHTGGVSFGDSKSPRERAAMQMLDRLHPRYAREVQAFVTADPAAPYRLAIDVARLRATHLSTVLAVLHDRAGGTLRHVRELALHLANQAQFLMLTPAAGGTARLRMVGEDEGFALAFRVRDEWDELLAVLRQLGVCHVHFHHLLGHDARVRALPAMLNVGYDVTAHDFYGYCTHITLTGEDGRYAGEPAPGQCACCPPGTPAPAHDHLARTVSDWRDANARLLNGARHVFAPSDDCGRRIAAFAPAAHLLVVPHTDIAPGALLPEPAPEPMQGDRPLRIVVIGALSVIKGADVLEAAALEAARRHAPLEFHLLGYCYRHLQTQPRARLTVHGEYQDEDLPGLLAWLQPDLVWFPAQWPETYSYTLSAVLTTGLPVVVPDIGAFAERLAGRAWSWVAPWNQSAAQWMEFFGALRSAHFIDATPPQPPAGTGTAAIDWRYDRDYSSGLHVPDAPAPALDAATLARYLPQPGANALVKTGLLGGLVWLRSLPVLRAVARTVPAHWQRRVKNWLQG